MKRYIIVLDKNGIQFCENSYTEKAPDEKLGVDSRYFYYGVKQKNKSKFVKWLILKLLGLDPGYIKKEKKEKVLQNQKYIDLGSVFKWIAIISFLLFIAASLQGCMKPLTNSPTKMEVTCPVYPKVKHSIWKSLMKQMNPDKCPEYQQERINRRNKRRNKGVPIW